MEKLRATFGKKKKVNLLSDPSVSPPRTPATNPATSLPSFSSLLGTPTPSPPPNPTSTSTSRPIAYYDTSSYSNVGGDGAIGGLEWNDHDATAQSHTASSQSNRMVSNDSDILVPTLGQVDQLTDAQEASMRHNVEPSLIEDEWSQPMTRARSTGDPILLPPSAAPKTPDRTVGSATNSTTSTPSRFISATNATSAAALVAGSRSASAMTMIPMTSPLNGSINGSPPSSRRGSGEQKSLSLPTTPIQPSLSASTLAPLSQALPEASPASSKAVVVATATPIQRPGAFAYPLPTSRPTVTNPHASMMHIGRAAAAEVRSLVQSERLTQDGPDTSNAPTTARASPAYLAYTAATKKEPAPAKEVKQSAKKQTKLSATTTSRQQSHTIAHLPTTSAGTSTQSSSLVDSSSTSLIPPLPPRTHIRQRYSTSLYGSRRSSDVSTRSTEDRQLAAAKEQLTQEQLIPINPVVHLIATAYILLYFALHLILPAIVALALPILVCYAFKRLSPTLDSYLRTHYPDVLESITTPVPISPTPQSHSHSHSRDLSPITAVVDESILTEVDDYHRYHRTAYRSPQANVRVIDHLEVKAATPVQAY